MSDNASTKKKKHSNSGKALHSSSASSKKSTNHAPDAAPSSPGAADTTPSANTQAEASTQSSTKEAASKEPSTASTNSAATTSPKDATKKASTNDLTKEPAEEPAEEPTKEPTTKKEQTKKKQPAEDSTRDPKKNPPTESSKGPTTPPTKDSTRNPANGSTKGSTNPSTKGPSKNPTEKDPAKKSSRTSTTERGKKPPKGPTDQPPKEPPKSPSSRSSKGTSATKTAELRAASESALADENSAKKKAKERQEESNPDRSEEEHPHRGQGASDNSQNGSVVGSTNPDTMSGVGGSGGQEESQEDSREDSQQNNQQNSQQNSQENSQQNSQEDSQQNNQQNSQHNSQQDGQNDAEQKVQSGNDDSVAGNENVSQNDDSKDIQDLPSQADRQPAAGNEQESGNQASNDLHHTEDQQITEDRQFAEKLASEGGGASQDHSEHSQSSSSRASRRDSAASHNSTTSMSSSRNNHKDHNKTKKKKGAKNIQPKLPELKYSGTPAAEFRKKTPYWGFSPRLRTVDEPTFYVYLTKRDYEFIQKITLEGDQNETGGDLFGSWHPDGGVEVHHAIGPGFAAKGTRVTFNQDVEFLQEAGTYLQTKNSFHVGDWHSHHRIGLREPSGGDDDTCVKALHKYQRMWFLIFICNIEQSRTGEFVYLNPFRYTNERMNQAKRSSYDREPGRIIILDNDEEFSQEAANEHQQLELLRAQSWRKEPTINNQIGILERALEQAFAEVDEKKMEETALLKYEATVDWKRLLQESDQEYARLITEKSTVECFVSAPEKVVPNQAATATLDLKITVTTGKEQAAELLDGKLGVLTQHSEQLTEHLGAKLREYFWRRLALRLLRDKEESSRDQNSAGNIKASNQLGRSGMVGGPSRQSDDGAGSNSLGSTPTTSNETSAPASQAEGASGGTEQDRQDPASSTTGDATHSEPGKATNSDPGNATHPDPGDATADQALETVGTGDHNGTASDNAKDENGGSPADSGVGKSVKAGGSEGASGSAPPADQPKSNQQEGGSSLVEKRRRRFSPFGLLRSKNKPHPSDPRGDSQDPSTN